jgi:DNA end-binding protein Ku
MRSIWKGSISFGLVTIPIALYPATAREELKFRLLRASDLSPVNYKRVAEADGKEVPWEQIVKGYEYEKGKFAVLKDEDFQRVDIEATQTVDIMSFVGLSEINPIYFHKPYYMEPTKGGTKAYVLLREALREKERVGIAKVVIKTRQHLAAVKPNGDALLLELMHFADELVKTDELHLPAKAEINKGEMEMARTLISKMTEPWQPDKYKDEYKTAVLELIEKKVAAGGRELGKPKPKTSAPTKVIDLAEVLRQSLQEAASGTKGKGGAEGSSRKKKRKAA